MGGGGHTRARVHPGGRPGEERHLGNGTQLLPRAAPPPRARLLWLLLEQVPGWGLKKQLFSSLPEISHLRGWKSEIEERAGLVSSEALGGICPLSLSSQGRDTFGVAWLVDVSVSASAFTWPPPRVRACIQMSPFHQDTSFVGLGPTSLQDDLILTNYSCHDPISK